MTKATKPALIIGAGIAGPVLALFLRKAGMDVALFEAAAGPIDLGVGLNLAPNGMNVLAAAGIAEQLRAVSVETSEWKFENQRGKLLAAMPAAGSARYGQPSIMITRAQLYNVLIDALRDQGIEVSYGKRVLRLVDRPGGPIAAVFEDGATVEGDVLVGADGIRSQVRSAAIPDAPKPAYTGLVAPGGLSPCIVGDASFDPGSKQPMHFIFGADGFFGYSNVVTPQGPRTLWWSTASAPLPRREEVAAVTKATLQRKLLDLHGRWAPPVPRLIETADNIVNIAIHDMPSLPRWSAGRVVLVGDAAHAVAPHSGQGASMAAEDAMLLAKLLRDGNGGDFQSIFARFEQMRRPRTDRVIALGRRQGQRKEKMSALAYWFQQQVMRILIPLSRTGNQDWLFGYKVNW